MFDVCEFNRMMFDTDELTKRIAERFPHSSVHVLDRQTWYVAELPEPIAGRRSEQLGSVASTTSCTCGGLRILGNPQTGERRRNLVRRNSLTEQVALRLTATERIQVLRLLGGLHTLGDRVEIERGAHRDDRP